MPGIGLPDELHCTLQYAVQQTFTSTTGGSSLQDFRGNDCYDPDATSTGTQPAWFDALMTIYKYGCVKASRIVANCKMLTSTNPGTMIVCPVNSQAELDASLLTNPMAAESMMNLNQAQFTFDMAMKSNAMAGLKSFEQYRASVNHWFSASASPSGAHNWFWRLAFRATDGTSTSVCYVDARIYYDVVLFHRNVSDEDLARPMKPQAVPERKTRRPSNVSCDKGDEKYEPGDFELIDNQDNVIARLHQTTRGPQLSHLPAVSNSKSREAMLSGVRSQSMK
jgi:hypothetical protein